MAGERPSNWPQKLILPPGCRVCEQPFEISQPPINARTLRYHITVDREVPPELMVDGLAKVANLATPMRRFDDLLGRERDQYANNDDADLADELAPAVQWFGQMNTHRSAQIQRQVRSNAHSSVLPLAVD